MHTLMQYLLPLALVAYVGVVVVLRSWLVYRRTGKNPIVFSTDDSAHGYIGRAMKGIVMVGVFDIALSLAAPAIAAQWLVPIPWLAGPALQIVALAILVIALVWIALAQVQMGDSFRIGIDEKNRTDLVERGLYRWSRNPIYVGMTASLGALLLALPNALTLAIVGVGVALIGVQVRLEEEHLRRLHGEQFEAYCRRVRRWL